MTENKRFDFATAMSDARLVVLDAAGFYRTMAKSGGYADPLIYVVLMGLIAGAIAAVMSMLGGGMRFGAGFGFFALITLPIVAVISSFISGAIMFVIWKLMGSTESFQTAWRCVAYSMALFPVMIILQWIPYLGSIVGVVAIIWLMMNASTEVHAVEKKKAQIVLGVIGVIMVLMNVSSERAGRHLESQMKQFNGQLEGIEDMSSEEAGEALGKFLKGLEKGQQE